MKDEITSQKMLEEIQVFVAQHGWKELFLLIQHDFGFHACDRGEREDWKARPKNEEQLSLIDKLCQFSEYEFSIGN